MKIIHVCGVWTLYYFCLNNEAQNVKAMLENLGDDSSTFHIYNRKAFD